MRQRRISGIWSLTLVFAAVLWAAPASATVLTYEYIQGYTGGPVGLERAPWISAIFDDEGTPGSVLLTLSDISLEPDEFVTEWLFNWDDGLGGDPGAELTIVQTTSSPLADNIDVGLDEFQAGGGAKFDIQIEFNSANNDDRFGAGDVAAFLITGTGITADQFDALSVGGGRGPNPTAAHIQGIEPAGEGGETGAWVDPIPEPSSIAVFALGVAALGFMYRRSLKRRVGG